MKQRLQEQEQVQVFTKPSQVFEYARMEGIKQVRRTFEDNEGGYCAVGLLRKYMPQYTIKHPYEIYSIVIYNDVENYTWEEFERIFKEAGY